MCSKCGKIGHVRGSCPLRRKQNTDTYTQISQSSPLTAAQRVTKEIPTRQRMAFSDESDGDLDIAAIQSEQQEALETSSLFNDQALTGVHVSILYDQDSPSTPDPICPREKWISLDSLEPDTVKRVGS